MDAFTMWLATVCILFFLSDKPVTPPVPPTPPEPKETIVLLPEADGKSTGIVIKTPGQEVVVTGPYQGVELSGGKVNSRTFSASEVQNLVPEVMQFLPEKPRSFTLHFEQNGTVLTAESLAMLDAVRQEIARRPAPEITVVGHTDRAGTDEANLALSVRRAEAVRDKLVVAGVPAQIIQVIGRGELEPAVMTEDGMAEPLNRRVEISVR